jgi:hypothetical protein
MQHVVILLKENKSTRNQTVSAIQTSDTALAHKYLFQQQRMRDIVSIKIALLQLKIKLQKTAKKLLADPVVEQKFSG